MGMQFGSFHFHKKTNLADIDDLEIENLIGVVSTIFEKHGVVFDEYEFVGFPEKEYPISECINCGYLTLDIDSQSIGLVDASTSSFLARTIHIGRLVEGQYVCDECREI